MADGGGADDQPSKRHADIPTQPSGGVGRTEPLGLAGTQPLTVALDATVPAFRTTPHAQPDAAMLPPFGPYSRVEVLDDQGAVGLVARGYNESIGRHELLKFLRDEWSSDAEFVRQFEREGKVLALLSHPNVVQVFATYQAGERACLAMEFLHGASLAQAAERSGGWLAPSVAVPLFLDAARGLAAAHDVGLLHRDIKPDNLFVVPPGRGRAGGLKLIDFGLASAMRHSGQGPKLTSDVSGGTPLFMAPELWRGETASVSADLYALGMTMFNVLTGEFPMPTASVAELRAAVLGRGPLRAPRELRPDLPPALDRLITRLLAKDPDQRPPDADQVVDELTAIAAKLRRVTVPQAGPYRGMQPYGQAEADVFMGRDSETEAVLERLVTTGAVALVGPPRAGKTSLALAGVAAALARGHAGVAYRVVQVQPGQTPTLSLVEAALSVTETAGRAELLATVRDRPRDFPELLAQATQEAPTAIVVDRLEGLLGCRDRGDAERFCVALGALALKEREQVKVIVTLRAEALDRLFEYRSLRELLASAFVAVRPLPPDRLVPALTEPAKVAGYRFEDETDVVSVVDDAGGNPALANLAMQAWWARRDAERRLLPSAVWHDDLGTVANVLCAHAEAAYVGMSSEQQRAADGVLARLVTADGKRARAQRASLIDPAASGREGEAALRRLLDEGVVVDDAGDVELAHEGLLHTWDRLRQLADRTRGDGALLVRVMQAAREWESAGRPDGALWDGAMADQLLGWFETSDANFSQIELRYIEAVRSRRERRSKLMRLAFALAGAALVGLVVFGFGRLRRQSQALAHAERAAASAGELYRSDTSRLLRQNAELLLARDPAQAILAARRSRDRATDKTLDLIGWRAVLAGVAQPLPTHGRGPALVRVAPKTGAIVTVGGDGTVHVLPADGAGRTLKLPDGEQPTALSVSPDGSQLAVGTVSGLVFTADVDAGGLKRVSRCAGAVSRIVAAGPATSATCVDSIGGERRLEVVRAGSTETWRKQLHANRVAWSPNGERLAAAQGIDLSLVVAGSEAPTRTAVEYPVTALAVSASGDVFFGDRRGGVGHWDTARPRERTRYAEGAVASPVRRLSLAPSGKHLVVIHDDGQAGLFSRDLRPRGIGVTTHAPLVAWQEDIGLVALASGAADAELIALSTGQRVAVLRGATQPLSSIAIGSKVLVTASADGGLRAYRPREVAATVGSGAHCGVGTNGTCRGCVSDAGVTVQRLADGKRSAAVAIPVALRPAPSPGVAANRACTAVAWITAGGGVAEYAAGKVSPVSGIRSRATSAAYASAGNSKVIRGAEAVTLVSESAGIVHIEGAGRTAFAPGRETLAVAVAGKLQFWDVDALKPSDAWTMEGALRATALAPSHDAKMVALARPDGTVSLASGEKRTPLVTFPHRLVCLAFGPSDRVLVGADDRGNMYLLDTDTKQFANIGELPGVSDCRWLGSSSLVAFRDIGGRTWLRDIHTRPVWMLPPPVDPLRDPAPVARWRGMTGP